MLLRQLGYCLGLCALTILAACSGAADTGLFSAPVGGSGGSTGGPPGPDSGTVHDAGRTVDATAPRDAAPPVIVDAGRDAPPVSKDFACGTETCTGTTCCAGQDVSPLPLGTPATYACVASPGACKDTPSTAAAVITCHDERDCNGGQVCCGAYDGTVYHSVTCTASCDAAPDGGRDHIQFCDPAKSSTDCPAGQSCSESSLLKTFYRCS